MGWQCAIFSILYCILLECKSPIFKGVSLPLNQLGDKIVFVASLYCSVLVYFEGMLFLMYRLGSFAPLLILPPPNSPLLWRVSYTPPTCIFPQL